MTEQLGVLKALVEQTTAKPDTTFAPPRDKIILTKMGENEDVEAFLTTFERLMTLYAVPRERLVTGSAKLMQRCQQQKPVPT